MILDIFLNIYKCWLHLCLELTAAYIRYPWVSSMERARASPRECGLEKTMVRSVHQPHSSPRLSWASKSVLVSGILRCVSWTGWVFLGCPTLGRLWSAKPAWNVVSHHLLSCFSEKLTDVCHNLPFSFSTVAFLGPLHWVLGRENFTHENTCHLK